MKKIKIAIAVIAINLLSVNICFASVQMCKKWEKLDYNIIACENNYVVCYRTASINGGVAITCIPKQPQFNK